MAIVMAYFRPHTSGRGRAELAQDSGSFRAAALDELAGIGLAGWEASPSVTAISRSRAPN
jgi:hypothetical protein